jgi:hypothetical protein
MHLPLLINSLELLVQRVTMVGEFSCLALSTVGSMFVLLLVLLQHLQQQQLLSELMHQIQPQLLQLQLQLVS